MQQVYIIKQIVKLYLHCNQTAAQAGMLVLALLQQQQRSVRVAEAGGHTAQACWEHWVLTQVAGSHMPTHAATRPAAVL